MISRKVWSIVLIAICVLFLAACGSGGPMPFVGPATMESPQATPTATGRSESPLPALQSPLATPASAWPVVATPSAGKAAIAGRLIRFTTGQPMANQNLSLPAILCPPGVADKDKREQCVYVIDEAFDPSALSDGTGRFVFRDIAAGEYVLLVGNRITQYTILTNEFNQPIIWKAEADKVLELGDLVVDLR
jgi:predicted small lipoprotein YifL